MANKEVFFRTPYNYDTNQVSDFTGLMCEDESLAVQSAKKETDINHIMAVFAKTGQIPATAKQPLTFDIEGVFDFQSAMNTIVNAQRAFAALPSNIRSRFANDPAQYIAFCENPDNLDEMRKLGLAVPAKPDVQGSGASAPDAPAGAATPKAS